VVIDHSHALFGEADLPKFPLDIDPKMCFTFTELTEQITSNNDWDSALSKVDSLDEMVIREVVNSLPHITPSEFDTNLLVKQITKRREQLPELLHYARTIGCFPNWL